MEGTTSGGYDAAEANAGDNKFQDYGHSHWHNSLIWGEELHNIGIVGPGLIYGRGLSRGAGHDTPRAEAPGVGNKAIRSEEHTSELQSRLHLVCRLLLEKKKT